MSYSICIEYVYIYIYYIHTRTHTPYVNNGSLLAFVHCHHQFDWWSIHFKRVPNRSHSNTTLPGWPLLTSCHLYPHLGISAISATSKPKGPRVGRWANGTKQVPSFPAFPAAQLLQIKNRPWGSCWTQGGERLLGHHWRLSAGPFQVCCETSWWKAINPQAGRWRCHGDLWSCASQKYSKETWPSRRNNYSEGCCLGMKFSADWCPMFLRRPKHLTLYSACCSAWDSSWDSIRWGLLMHKAEQAPPKMELRPDFRVSFFWMRSRTQDITHFWDCTKDWSANLLSFQCRSTFREWNQCYQTISTSCLTRTIQYLIWWVSDEDKVTLFFAISLSFH